MSVCALLHHCRRSPNTSKAGLRFATKAIRSNLQMPKILSFSCCVLFAVFYHVLLDVFAIVHDVPLVFTSFQLVPSVHSVVHLVICSCSILICFSFNFQMTFLMCSCYVLFCFLVFRLICLIVS